MTNLEKFPGVVMREDEKISITIEIAEKEYKMTVTRGEEEIVRRAAKSIKDQIEVLRRRHDPNLVSLVEFLSMAAFYISRENEINKQELASSRELRDLEALVTDLDEYLDQRQK